MMAEKYKAESYKFKKLLGKANISVQNSRNYNDYVSSSGPRYSHI
jgi:thiamine biosynthesis lipoprotein ApbE